MTLETYSIFEQTYDLNFPVKVLLPRTFGGNTPSDKPNLRHSHERGSLALKWHSVNQLAEQVRQPKLTSAIVTTESHHDESTGG